MSSRKENGCECLRNVVKEWEENREWLHGSGYVDELKEVVSELHALKWGLRRLSETKDDYELEGIASLIGTVASRVDDMTHGRLKDMTLPK